MSLTLLDNQTRASPGTFFPQLGGGGGGPSITTSNLSVSSIVGNAPGGQMTLDAPAGIFINGFGLNFTDTGATISFLNNDGAMSGVSSINNLPYPPAGGAVASLSTITTGGGYGGQGQSYSLNAIPFPTQLNKWYTAQIEITDMSFVAPGPSANDCFNVSIEDATSQTNLGTFNMAQLSTNRGTLGELGFSVSGPYESLSTNAYFVFKQSAGSCSTFTVTGGTGWLTPLSS